DILHVAAGALTVKASYPSVGSTQTASSPDGQLLLAAVSPTREAYFFASETGALVASFEGAGFSGAAFSTDGGYAVVTDDATDTFPVSAVDGTTATLQGTCPCDSAAPGLVAATGDVVAVVSGLELHRFDRATGALLDSRTITSGEVLYLTLS